MSNATLREALEAVRRTLHEANELDDSPICDTIWMPGAGSETLFDYIDAALAADDAARGTMREQFEAWFAAYEGDLSPWSVWQACCAQASRAAAPQAEPLDCDNPTYQRGYSDGQAYVINTCAEFLKEGELPHERMERDHRDSLALLKLLAAEKIKNESLLGERVCSDGAAPQSVEPASADDMKVYDAIAANYTAPPSAPTDAEWIACSERLPEDKAPILMVGVEFGPRADYTTDQYAGWLSQGTWVRWPHRPPPTHWRPLPAPPTKKGAGA